MARRLRFNGTDSKNGSCPAVHEDSNTGEIIVQEHRSPTPRTSPGSSTSEPGDAAVVVPRELLVDFGPKEVTACRKLIGLDEFGGSSRPSSTRPGAWRPGAATLGREDPEVRGVPGDRHGTWTSTANGAPNIAGRRRAASASDVSASSTTRRPRDSSTCSTTPGATRPSARTSGTCGARTPTGSSCPTEDFWIFDSRLVALLNFDDDDDLPRRRADHGAGGGPPVLPGAGRRMCTRSRHTRVRGGLCPDRVAQRNR